MLPEYVPPVTHTPEDVRRAYVELRDYEPPPVPIEDLRGNAPPPSNWKYRVAVGKQILKREYEALKKLTVILGGKT